MLKSAVRFCELRLLVRKRFVFIWIENSELMKIELP